jgi:hypothetical protein
MSANLVVFPNDTPHEKQPESIGSRIRELHAQERALARDHVDELRRGLLEAARLAAEVAQGGDAYPVGARELARRLADECNKQAASLAMMVGRDHDH